MERPKWRPKGEETKGGGDQRGSPKGETKGVDQRGAKLSHPLVYHANK